MKLRRDPDPFEIGVLMLTDEFGRKREGVVTLSFGSFETPIGRSGLVRLRSFGGTRI